MAVDRALSAIQGAFRKYGFEVAPFPPCHVVLWDMAFPLPDEWEVSGLPEPACPVAIPPENDDSPALVLLPTHDHGRFRSHDQAWLESVAVHEGFHGLLVRWVGRTRIGQLRNRGCWKKFEEMCAVAMEACLLRGRKGWMDYGRSWQATLSLSHCDNDWAAFLSPQDGDFAHPVNREDYGHFALLAFLDRVWQQRNGREHWMKTVWEAGKTLGASVDPWEVLDKKLKSDGGVSGLFERYVHQTAFPTQADSVPARLHTAFGPPCTAVLERGMGAKVFAIGPLAAQLLSCRIGRGGGRGTVRIVDYRGLDDTVVRAFEVRGDGKLRAGVPLSVGKPTQQDKAKVWEFPLDGAKTGEVQILVLQPNHAGRGLAFAAEWA